MRLLYVIFVLSVAALIWIVFAMTRHIRRQQAQPASETPALDAETHAALTKESLLVGKRKEL